MLKKADIERTLEQIEDYSAFYDQEENAVEGSESEEDDMLGVF